jgi:hypothetical protein
MRSDELKQLLPPAITDPQPDHLRRRAVEQAALLKVRVLGDDGKAVGARILPNVLIGLAAQSAFTNVGAAAKKCRQQARELGQQIFIKEQLHAFGRTFPGSDFRI